MSYRDFRLFWLSSMAEHAGEFMEFTALSWLVWEKWHDPYLLGLLLFCRVIPTAVFPLIGGVGAAFGAMCLRVSLVLYFVLTPVRRMQEA